MPSTPTVSRRAVSVSQAGRCSGRRARSPQDAGKWIDAPLDKKGQVQVQPDLTIPAHPEIFVIGDLASVTAPARATSSACQSRNRWCCRESPPPAIQEGRICRSRHQPPRLRAARSTHRLSIGTRASWHRFRAVSPPPTWGVAHLTGFPAWLIWAGVHIFYLIGFGNRLLVLTQWALTALTFQRGGRLFPQALAPDTPKPDVPRSGADAAV